MLQWLYSKAKQIKRTAFFIGGLGVAGSVATIKASTIFSWISNLIGVAGASIYSIAKNAEVAEAIGGTHENIKLLCQELSLPQEPPEHEYEEKKYCLDQGLQIGLPEEGLSSAITIMQQLLDHGELQGDIAEVKENLSRKFAQESKRYADHNAIVQTIFGGLVIILNAIANAKLAQNENYDWDTANILNAILTPLCVVIQYLLHTKIYAARLRQTATKADELFKCLQAVNQSTLFKVTKIQRYSHCLDSLDEEIKRLEGDVLELDHQIRIKESASHGIEQQIEALADEEKSFLDMVGKNIQPVREKIQDVPPGDVQGLRQKLGALLEVEQKSEAANAQKSVESLKRIIALFDSQGYIAKHAQYVGQLTKAEHDWNILKVELDSLKLRKIEKTTAIGCHSKLIMSPFSKAKMSPQ